MNHYKEVFHEVRDAVLPMTIVVILLQLLLIRLPWQLFVQFLIGTAFVMVGLYLFLLGVNFSILPLGKLLGNELPGKGMLIFLGFSFVLGFVITVAEPDVRILAGQVETVSAGEISSQLLVGLVALGVGVFVLLAMLRIATGWSTRKVLAISYLVMLALSFFVPPQYVPISFDAGGVTTGPMTVPFILSMGLGTAAVLQGRSSLADSFGLVGLASIGPIIAVMLLGVVFG